MNLNKVRPILTLTLLMTLASSVYAESDKDVAEKLTTLFRSARAVVSQNKDMIGDPKKAPETDKFLDSAKKNFARSAEKKLEENDEATKAMLDSIKEVVEDARSGKYDKKWAAAAQAPGKFLPARFAREVAEKFSKRMSGKMAIKLTTANDLLVNKDNQADKWESEIMDGKFKSTKESDSVPAVITEAEIMGKKASRYILPEYYNSTCLSCHGGEAGKQLHPGKIDGQLGGFGGAISFTLFKK